MRSIAIAQYRRICHPSPSEGTRKVLARLGQDRYNGSRKKLWGGDRVPADMKEIIAQAAKTLLMEKHARKLTVKDAGRNFQAV